MNVLTAVKDISVAVIEKLSRLPYWLLIVVIGGVAAVLTIPLPHSSASTPSPSLVEAVRADIQSVTAAQSKTTAAIETGNAESKSHTQLLTEIRDLLKGPGRKARASDSGPENVSISFPDGTPHSLLDLATKATGRFTVENNRYRASLISHGFQESELPADEGQCRVIYDAWKSSQAPQLQSAPRYQPPRYQCDGKSCRLIR